MQEVVNMRANLDGNTFSGRRVSSKSAGWAFDVHHVYLV